MRKLMFAMLAACIVAGSAGAQKPVDFSVAAGPAAGGGKIHPRDGMGYQVAIGLGLHSRLPVVSPWSVRVEGATLRPLARVFEAGGAVRPPACSHAAGGVQRDWKRRVGAEGERQPAAPVRDHRRRSWIADAHGGRLELARSSAEGSEFVLTLPAGSA